MGRRAIEFFPLETGAPRDGGRAIEFFGWVQAPAGATQLQVCLPMPMSAALGELTMRLVAERDPKCHPNANVPRHSAYSPPAIGRVRLPAALAGLQEILHGSECEIADQPRSISALERRAAGNVVVIDPAWIVPLDLSLADLERMAARGVVIADLESLAMLIANAGAAETEIATYSAPNEFMAARNEFADWPTRGLALLDTVPYGAIDERGRFFLRVLRATRAWKKYADGNGFATLLSSQTPWATRCNDVLSAARALDGGELIGTDLPWLMAGHFGNPIAPAIGGHLLRMHVGEKIEPWTQYWCRWHEDAIVLRDIADLAKRYSALRALRWASDDARIARLGVSLPPAVGAGGARAARRHIVIDSGRIDAADYHDGLTPQPVMILLRQLARESSEQTAWGREKLSDLRITWRFETAAGLKYATLFDSARELESVPPTMVLRLRCAAGLGAAHVERDMDERGVEVVNVTLDSDVGLFGDRSLARQAEIVKIVMELLRGR